MMIIIKSKSLSHKVHSNKVHEVIRVIKNDDNE